MKISSMLKTAGVGLLLASIPHGLAQPFAQPTYPKVNGNVELEFWSWVPNIDKTVQEFEKAFPNIKIKLVNPGAGQALYTKLATAIRAGSGAPDIAQIAMSNLPSFVDSGGLVDLSALGAASLRSFFVPWTWNQVSFGNQVYAIPQDSGPFAMLYRKDLFDQYGIAVPKTWDEYARAAVEFNQKSGGKVKIGNFYANQAPWFLALAWANNAVFWQRSGETWTQTLNNPQSLRVLSFWNNLIQQKLVTTYNSYSPDFWNAAGNGEIATSMEAAWGQGTFTGSLKDKGAGQWRVADLPQWSRTSKLRSGNWGGSANIITKQSKNPEAAFLFISWLNTSQVAVETNFRGGGLFPAAIAGLKSPVLEDATTPSGKFFGGQNTNAVFARAAEGVAVNFPWPPFLPFVLDNYTKHVNAMVRGQLTPSQVLDNWQRESITAAIKDGYSVK
jgi:multiple sugar transport system substrate-binding protein